MAFKGMNQEPEAQAVEYRCPGERSPVSEAVHLGRLAGFYPACRRCPHGEQTGTLSSRQVKRVQETRRRGQIRPLFHSEGAAGTYLNDLDPASARRMAAALGVYLRRRPRDTSDSPRTIIASDGRPLTPEMVAAVGEGLRWAGCHVVDIGAASAPCTARAIDHLNADGGILVGNPEGRAHTVGLKFWADGARPLSEGEALDTVRRLFETGVDRPTRRYGSLRRLQAEGPYLDGLAESYHALRPLRFLLHTTCPPVLGYLGKLTAEVACEAIPCPARPDQLGDQVRAERAHFAVRIDDDGQRCQLWDEGGRPVAEGQLFLLVARHLLAEQPGRVIVLEEPTDIQVARQICASGGCPVTSDARRAAMERAMRENGALLGGGPSGRFWYRSADGHTSADGLMTLTLLLKILSRSDRRLSQVLDAEAAVA
jgi:phosphomannomutase